MREEQSSEPRGDSARGGRIPSWRWLMPAVIIGAVLAPVALSLVFLPPQRPEAPDVVWAFEPKQRGAFLSSPLVADGRVYAAALHEDAFRNAGAVYCLDQATGKPVWR